MKIDALARRMATALFVSGLFALAGAGCSGSQQEEETMEATPEEEPKEDAEAEPAAEEPAEEAAATAEPEPVAEVPATPVPSMNSGVDKSRVVRYVSKDEATVHGQPDDKAEAVGKLMKGDMILVVETNGWGKISDTMYVRMDTLSKKAVPRNRNPAVWGKPAH